MTFNRFNICQAFQQLEADYNVGGWVRERPSNQRRMESIGCQLERIGYRNLYEWVDIVPECGYADRDCDGDQDEIREIYLSHVLAWGLPVDAEMMAFMHEFFTADFLAQYPQCSLTEYQQGKP